MLETESYEDYQKKELKKYEKAAKETDSKILDEIVDKNKKKTDTKKTEQCSMIYRICDEACDMYKEGDLKTLKDVAEDIAKAIQAID